MTFTVLKKIQPFFLNKCFLDFCKSLNFRVPKIFILTILPVFLCFHRGVFRGFYSTILEVFLHAIVLALLMHSMLS